VSTMNENEHPTSPQTPDRAERPERSEGETSIYVRRGRTPTLSFWVTLALAVPGLVALFSAPFLDFADLGGVFTFVLLAVLFVGLPLAAIAAVIDSVRHRGPRRRDR
jgi:hypothetical protein